MISGGAAELVLEPLTLEPDDTRVSGSVRASDALGETPAVRFALRADALDSRRYLPFNFPGAEQEAAPPP